MKKKTVALLLSLVLVFGVIAGGTLAWLTQKTDSVVNTFTYGDINITLDETTGTNYTIIPGKDLAKDPKITVKAGSEDCWLFFKYEKTGTFVEDDIIFNLKLDGWTEGDGTNIPKDVYYREVPSATTDTVFYLLQGNTTYPNGVIQVKDTLTKEDIKDLGNPTLTFTAYACQKDGINDAPTAWAKINPTSGN